MVHKSVEVEIPPPGNGGHSHSHLCSFPLLLIPIPIGNPTPMVISSRNQLLDSCPCNAITIVPRILV